eukprot:43484-Amphidinium_carterae.1
MAISASTQSMPASAPGPMDIDQGQNAQPMHNPLQYDTDERSDDSDSTIDRDIRDNMEIIMWNTLVTQQCAPEVRDQLHRAGLILATNEEQTTRSTILMREQLIEMSLKPPVKRDIFNPMAADTDQQRYLWNSLRTRVETMFTEITGSTKVQIITNINNILTNSHARADAHSSIYFRRAEDVSIVNEFNPVFNGQDPMNLNFQELLGRPIGVWTMDDWHRIDNIVDNTVVGPFNFRVVCHRDTMASQ